MSTTRLSAQRDRTLHELTYRSRQALVAAKERLGLSRRGDKTFYVEQFARMLRAGAFGHNTGVTVHQRTDGAGAQAQAMMSAIAFAHAHGICYVHRPFASIEHAETDMPTWVRMCEDHFNLGAGETDLGIGGAPLVGLESLKFVPPTAPVIAAAEHYMHYCNRDTTAWERVQSKLRTKFWQNKQRRAREPRELRVAVHMRRGDVSPDNRKVARNFTPNSVFVAALACLQSALARRGHTPRIEIFSQGEPTMFGDLAALGAELHLDAPALDTHRALVEADVLIMSKSAFSYTAAILNEGIVLYDPQKYRPLDGWIARTPGGAFDETLLARRLDAVIASRQA